MHTSNNEDVIAPTATPRCAVVVSTRNRGRKIRPLVESVLRSSEPSLEVIIVDQSDERETETEVGPFLSDSRLRYVRSEQRGASRGRNLGASMTSAPVIAITDDDCIVPADWITRMVLPFDRNPRVGVVFCNVDPVPVDEPGHTPSIRFSRSHTLLTLEEAWARAAKNFSLGAGMAIRRTTFEEIGGFDELLGPGSTFPSAEDNDLAWRALRRGWLVYENAETTVLHDGFRSMEEVRGLVRRDCLGAGGAMAKYLRAGYWNVTSLVASGLYKFAIREPAEALAARRVPRGWRRPYWLLQGLASGLRRPMDSSMLLYRDAD